MKHLFRSDQKALQVDRLDLSLELINHIGPVYHERLPFEVRSLEGYFFHYFFDYPMQPPRPQVLCVGIHLVGLLSYLLNCLNPPKCTSSVNTKSTS